MFHTKIVEFKQMHQITMPIWLWAQVWMINFKILNNPHFLFNILTTDIKIFSNTITMKLLLIKYFSRYETKFRYR